MPIDSDTQGVDAPTKKSHASAERFATYERNKFYIVAHDQVITALPDGTTLERARQVMTRIRAKYGMAILLEYIEV